MKTKNVDFGIELINAPKGKRGKSLGFEDIERVSRIVESLQSNGGDNIDDIDDMVANMCQNLTNKQIATAYQQIIGVYDLMKNSTSIRRALKQLEVK